MSHPTQQPLGTGLATRRRALALAATSRPLDVDLAGDGDLLGAMRVVGCDAVDVVVVVVLVVDGADS